MGHFPMFYRFLFVAVLLMIGYHPASAMDDMFEFDEETASANQQVILTLINATGHLIQHPRSDMQPRSRVHLQPGYSAKITIEETLDPLRLTLDVEKDQFEGIARRLSGTPRSGSFAHHTSTASGKTNSPTAKPCALRSQEQPDDRGISIPKGRSKSVTENEEFPYDILFWSITDDGMYRLGTSGAEVEILPSSLICQLTWEDPEVKDTLRATFLHEVSTQRDTIEQVPGRTSCAGEEAPKLIDEEAPTEPTLASAELLTPTTPDAPPVSDGVTTDSHRTIATQVAETDIDAEEAADGDKEDIRSGRSPASETLLKH